MSRWGIYTPEGVQDILFEECYTKRVVEHSIRDVFRRSGYQEVETPIIEFYDTFTAGGDMVPQETMFKFFDSQGRILVLRPEMTIPVARLASSKYKDALLPLRFSYIGNCYKYNEQGGGKQKEFTQAGVELIGDASPEADAEVIATAINSVLAAGIEDFQIDIGQVEFFKGLMEETGLSDQEIEQMRKLIDSKDFLGIEELVEKHDIKSGLGDLVLSLPRLFGTADIIEDVSNRTQNERALAALKNLKDVLLILDDYGMGKYLTVDLGMVQSLNYYMGIIFKGFTYGVGFPLLSGGRYDRLLERFGSRRPATGFSLGVNLAMRALERQRERQELDLDRISLQKKPAVDTIVCYTNAGRKAAFLITGELRRQGLIVEMNLGSTAINDLSESESDFTDGCEYRQAKARNIDGIILVFDENVIRLYNLFTGEIEKTSFSALLRREIIR